MRGERYSNARSAPNWTEGIKTRDAPGRARGCSRTGRSVRAVDPPEELGEATALGELREHSAAPISVSLTPHIRADAGVACAASPVSRATRARMKRFIGAADIVPEELNVQLKRNRFALALDSF